MYEVSRVNVEIKTHATLTFTRDTSYIRKVKHYFITLHLSLKLTLAEVRVSQRQLIVNSSVPTTLENQIPWKIHQRCASTFTVLLLKLYWKSVSSMFKEFT